MSGEYVKKEPNITVANFRSFHFCELTSPWHGYGPAIDDCFQDEDGYLYISNGEYGSQVNFCPICGYEAKKKVDE